MVTKIKITETAARCEAIAKQIIEGNGSNRGLMQTGLVIASEHVNKHGEYNNTLVPLLIAAASFGGALQKTAILFAERHTKVRFNPKGYKGAMLTKAWADGAKDLFGFDKNAKPVAIDGSKRWDTYKAEGVPNTEPVDVSERISRMGKTLQKLIDERRAVGADGKPVTLNTIHKMISDMSSSLEYRETVTATTTDGKQVTIVKQLTEVPVAKPVAIAVAA